MRTSTSRPVKGPDFFDREALLDRLESAFRRKQNVAIVGPRRIGKSSIALQLLDTLGEKPNVMCAYFKVHENIAAVSFFAMKLLIAVLDAYFDRLKQSPPIDLLEMMLNVELIEQVAEQVQGAAITDLSNFMIRNFPANGYKERVILQKAAQFSEDLCREKGLELAFVLDEFQAIVRLEQYQKCFRGGELLPFLEGIMSDHGRVWYCLTGSLVRIMEQILESPDSAFYGRFTKLSIGGFETEDTRAFIAKIAETPVTGDAMNLIVQATGGNPFYLLCLCAAASERAKTLGRPTLDMSLAQDVILSELTEGDIEAHCNYVFENSLQRANRGISLKQLVEVIARKRGASPSELARALSRDIGYVSPLLRDLKAVDLIQKEERNYVIQDYFLSLWLENVYGLTQPRVDKIRQSVIENYDQYVAKLKSERGILVESYLRDLILKFDGKKFGAIKLPKFQTVESLNIYDNAGVVFKKQSNIQIDAVCQGDDNWLAEFRHTERLVTKGDLQKLTKMKTLVEKKANILVSRLMYITVAGFRESALRFAKDENIWCVDPKLLNQLLDRYGMRRLDSL